MTTPRCLKPTPHLQRVQRWRNLASVQGKCMIDLVLVHLVPAIEALGFTRIDASSMGPDHQPSGSEVCFERMVGDTLDCITVNFEKYGTPRFQIHGVRRHNQSPYPMVRAANIVKRRSQYYYFWGKPWWLPSRWWPEVGSKRAVTNAIKALPQMVDFLECDVRGANISRDIHER